jgi:type I restriction enzyme, S subunit
LEILEIPIPPISMQNQFATKIKSIEKQKSLINQSIDDVQQLFDYTMDKYFV